MVTIVVARGMHFCSALYRPLDALASAHVASFEVALAKLFALVMHPGWRHAQGGAAPLSPLAAC